MTTLVNHAIFLQAPKGVIPDIAARGKDAQTLVELANFFSRCAGGMPPGLAGDTLISIGQGSSSVPLSYAYALMAFATCPAATVIDVNGAKFTAFAGAGGGTGTFSISGADAADATAFCAAVVASIDAHVRGQVTACNLAGTVALASVAAGEIVKINGRTFTATSRPTGVIGDFSITGSDTADGDALVAAIAADPTLNKLVVAINASGTVTLRQRSGTTGLRVEKIGAGITLGGLSSARLAAVSTAIVSSLIPGTMGNSLSVKTLGIASSATLTVATAVVTNTVLVNGVTFTAIKQRATGTITAASAVAADVCSINGVVFTGVAGAVNLAATPNNFSIDTSDTAAAASLVLAINAHRTLSGVVTATSVAGVVTVRAVNSGTAGNAITLTGTAVRLAASGAVLAGGIAVANNEFDVSPGATDDQVAVDLARAINASTTTLVASYVRAQRTASAVVTVYSLVEGTRGNGIPLSTTGGTITASATRLAGGAIGDTEGVQASCTLTLASVLNGQTCTINGVVYTAHTNTQANDQFSIAGDDTADAAALALAINNSTTAGSAEIVATSALGVVTVRARRGGIAGNLITVAVSAATITIGGAAASGRLGGGAAPTMVVPATDRLAGGAGADAAAPTLWQF